MTHQLKDSNFSTTAYDSFFKLFVKDRYTFKFAALIFDDINFSHPHDCFDSIVDHEFFSELNDTDESKTKVFVKSQFE